MAEKHCKRCEDCIHHGTCYREGNRKAYTGDLDLTECKLYKSAADVVEVVRCKDCKNAYINSFSVQSGVAVCRFLANRSNGELAIVQQDDFCSYGERKEQDNV